MKDTKSREIVSMIASKESEIRKMGFSSMFLEAIEKSIESAIQTAVREERKRIEEVFIKKVPPHALDLEDGVWLKRLLNRAFNHKNNNMRSIKDQVIEVINATITAAILDGQNQIHDLKSGKATSEEITKRMNDAFKLHSERIKETLIWAGFIK